ncbi:DUF6477 family protein [Oceaniglobus indicus]|uniref:DUF6477 family protein n=1 Tax=Oceaniglobus indicus TaxID=2047749 RepID=UPI000C18C083|nr:DUF6477 family protein [Oceaniglobus indicus]
MNLRPVSILSARPANRTALGDLRRPRLLIRAARHALTEYDRQRGLARIFDDSREQATCDLLGSLIVREAEMDRSRLAGEAGYSVSRHIEVLVALMAEARQQAAEDQGAPMHP